MPCLKCGACCEAGYGGQCEYRDGIIVKILHLEAGKIETPCMAYNPDTHQCGNYDKRPNVCVTWPYRDANGKIFPEVMAVLPPGCGFREEK